MLKLVHNPTDSPVVVDDDGHTLGGGGWDVADSRAQAVKDAVDGDRLVYAAEPGDDADPAAKAAWQQLQQASKPARSTKTTQEASS